MNTLDVCCALIELPAARGPLLLGAKRKRGSPTGFFTNSPAEKWNQGRMPGTPSYGKYGKSWDAPSSPSACSPPYGTRSLNALSALSPFCAVWNFAPCPGPWNMKPGVLLPPYAGRTALGACGPPCVKGMAGRTPLKAASPSNSIAPRESSRPCLKRLQKHLGTFPTMRYIRWWLLHSSSPGKVARTDITT